jgi:hypothetical protein
MAQTARISQRSSDLIQEMALLTGMPKTQVIELALETYRRHERLRLFNESYSRLRSKKKMWSEELKERQELEGTLSDGLEKE